MGRFSHELQKLKDFERIFKKSEAKLRIRRDAICGGIVETKGTLAGKIAKVDLDNNLLRSFKKLTQTSPKFNLRHVLDDIDFDVPLTLGRKSTLANKRQ